MSSVMVDGCRFEIPWQASADYIAWFKAARGRFGYRLRAGRGGTVIYGTFVGRSTEPKEDADRRIIEYAIWLHERERPGSLTPMPVHAAADLETYTTVYGCEICRTESGEVESVRWHDWPNANDTRIVFMPGHVPAGPNGRQVMTLYKGETFT